MYIYISNFICYLDLDIPSGVIKHDGKSAAGKSPECSHGGFIRWENI